MQKGKKKKRCGVKYNCIAPRARAHTHTSLGYTRTVSYYSIYIHNITQKKKRKKEKERLDDQKEQKNTGKSFYGFILLTFLFYSILYYYLLYNIF